MKKFLSYLAVAFSIFISIIFPVNAYYNLGSLELKPLTGNNPEWFIEYLKPGQTAQGRVQISNFDSREKKIQLYSADNADNEDAHFFTQTAEEIKSAEANIGQWITLPVHELTLKPQESRIVDFSFVIPQKAGIGLHKGAVIAREITMDTHGNEIKFEKGLRVYVNVMGPSITSSYQTKELFDESYKQFHYQVTTANNGTTDLEATYGLGLEEVLGSSAPESWESHKIKPDESFTADISLQKPDIGIYNVFVLKGEEKHFLKTVIFIPLWLGAMIIIALAVMIKGVEKIKKEQQAALALEKKALQEAEILRVKRAEQQAQRKPLQQPWYTRIILFFSSLWDNILALFHATPQPVKKTKPAQQVSTELILPPAPSFDHADEQFEKAPPELPAIPLS